MDAVGEREQTMDFFHYVDRYSQGEWRAPIFRDLILADAAMLRAQNPELVFLDIGCGGGFDADLKIQTQLAHECSAYIGVEPDKDIHLGTIFTAVHRCLFEAAPIPPASIDIAFSVMVMEHLQNPQQFWDKVHSVLRPGGVFWGFTVDARHPVAIAAACADRLHIKELYLNWLHGKRGEERYEDYSVWYRSNTPAQIHSLAKAFNRHTILSFQSIGQIRYYLPTGLKWLGDSYERLSAGMGWPGINLAVRAEKAP